MGLIDADELKSKIVGKGSDSLYSRLSEGERKWLFEIIDSLEQPQPSPASDCTITMPDEVTIQGQTFKKGDEIFLDTRTGKVSKQPNRLEDVNDVDKEVDTGLQPGVIYKAPAEWKQPNKLDELIQGYGHTTGIIQIFNEISSQLKELRGERD